MQDWKTIVGDVGNEQYKTRIEYLRNIGKNSAAIERTVADALNSLQSSRSFVIYGEPQSGKTEMMIALNARLLDEGHETIVNLLTDSVDLLSQSLRRFQRSGLSPSPKVFSDLPDNVRSLKGRKWVIFCKKNARDLEKLVEKLRQTPKLIVIDDEADYASPDANINKKSHDKTRINGLINDLISDNGGIYIGVTATPARLNLNNTFQNESEKWVDFRPHSEYVGQDFFFPQSERVSYRLHLFDTDEGNERVEIQNAVLHFLCGVAEQHLKGHAENFTMLVHTSGKKDEHAEDYECIEETINKLSNPESVGFAGLVKKLQKFSVKFFPAGSDAIVDFVLRNIHRNSLVLINSSNSKSGKVVELAEPTSVFSFGVGGNIISRGVTFDNLLSLYFTRSVKGKFTQDTYIQRARMFGSRGKYKNDFQLWIPHELMRNWSRCFAFHQLAIEACRSSEGAPIWLSDHKTIPTSPASINRSTVDFGGGEMLFALFDYDRDKVRDIFERNGRTDLEILDIIKLSFDASVFPDYFYNYLKNEIVGIKDQISFHRPSSFGTGSRSKYSDLEKKNIRRTKGIFSANEYERSEKPKARHHLKVYYNSYGKARILYKINGGTIRFIKNW